MFELVVYIHVAAGTIALLSGIFAFALKRNTPRHRIAGKIYFWAMTTIFFTGLGMALYRSSLFFIFISLFSYYSCLIAFRSLKLKQLHNKQRPASFDWMIESVAGLSFVLFFLFGFYFLYRNRSLDALIPITFGIVGIRGVYSNVKVFIHGTREKNYWLRKHIGNMMGSYIAGVTAFLVNQSEHIPLPPVVLWLGPTVIIVPFIVLELRKTKPVLANPN